MTRAALLRMPVTRPPTTHPATALRRLTRRGVVMARCAAAEPAAGRVPTVQTPRLTLIMMLRMPGARPPVRNRSG
jgi:hypothetical protein